jgi:signal transduction histidine kinase
MTQSAQDGGAATPPQAAALRAAELCLAQEDARRRLANELHDQALQTLAAARINLQLLGQHLPSAEALQLQQRALDLVSQTECQLRALTADLNPRLLAEGGLGAALQWLVEHFEKQYGVAARVNARGNWRDIPVTTRILLFYSARELLTNAGRHAKAARVTVRLSAGRGRVILSVEDDGLGFAPSACGAEGREGDGRGLFDIRERLRHVGGSLDLHSQPGQGATLTLTVPCAETMEV